MACGSIRQSFQQMGIDLAYNMITQYGSTYIFHDETNTQYTIVALALPGQETQNFGPDEDRLTLLIPYQVGFTKSPESGCKIITTDTAAITYAIERSNSDDGAFPVTWECLCFRWMHESGEIDGSA